MTHPPTLSRRWMGLYHPNLILGSAYGVGSPTNPSLHCPHRGWAGRAGHTRALTRAVLRALAGLYCAPYALAWRAILRALLGVWRALLGFSVTVPIV